MLGDGVCDSECNTNRCGYDFSDCCSSSCAGDEGTCSADCLYSECSYDEACPDDFLRISARYLQMLTANFATRLDFSTCFNEDPYCDEATLRDFYAGVGVTSACSSLSCLGQYGQGQCCAEDMHCLVCIGSYCLECEEGYYQHYSQCVEACPSGYREPSKIPMLCYPSYDYTSQANPEQYFVSTTETRGAYRPSLQAALAETWKAYTVIYLTEAITDLRELSEAEMMRFDTASTLTPLERTYKVNCKVIKLTTNLCNLHLSSNCLEDNAKIRLTNAQIELYIGEYSLVIENVGIDGYSSLDNTCSVALCSYCPYSQPYKGSYVDDRYDIFSSWPNLGACTKLKGSSFIYGDCGSTLVLDHVAVTDFRQQLEAFVRSYGTVLMTDVSFTNVQPSAASDTAFIVQNCEGCTGNCQFKLVRGAVKYLNNGYEYRSDISHLDRPRHLCRLKHLRPHKPRVWL
jgi:hypothetical protein